MANVYERLGVPHDHQRQGSIDPAVRRHHAPEVAAAMVEASQHCVDMAELQARASRADRRNRPAPRRAGHRWRRRRPPARRRRLRHRPRSRAHEPPARHPRHAQRDRDRAQPAQLLRPHDARGRRAPDRGRPAGPLRRRRRARRRGLGDRRCDRRAHRGGPLGRRRRARGRRSRRWSRSPMPPACRCWSTPRRSCRPRPTSAASCRPAPIWWRSAAARRSAGRRPRASSAAGAT